MINREYFIEEPAVKFITLKVKTALIVHGFNDNNEEIIESVSEDEFVPKMIALHRVQSVSEQYLLVTGSHDRMMYWEYEGDMEGLVKRMAAADLLVE